MLVDSINLQSISSISSWRELSGRIAYLGPDGSFTHQAATDCFGPDGDYLAQPSIQAVFECIEMGNALFGIVPIENNQEGVVLDTIDLLYEKDLLIAAETQMEIHFVLATQASTLDAITHIYSKDIAFRQCSSFLRDHFTDLPAEMVSIESTSKAAQLAAEQVNVAAICSPVAAQRFGIPVLFDTIGNSAMNRTRFLILAKGHKNLKTLSDKTTLIAQLPNTNSPGVLVNFLQEFAAQNINLTRIESRPLRQGATFQYWFLLELEGHFDDPSIQEILQFHTADVRWLGSYSNSDC